MNIFTFSTGIANSIGLLSCVIMAPFAKKSIKFTGDVNMVLLCSMVVGFELILYAFIKYVIMDHNNDIEKNHSGSFYIGLWQWVFSFLFQVVASISRLRNIFVNLFVTTIQLDILHTIQLQSGTSNISRYRNRLEFLFSKYVR